MNATTLAILMILVTGFVLAGMDGAGKMLSSAGVPVIMVLWGRYFIHTAITFVAIAGQTRSVAFLRAKRPGLQFVRACALFGATTFMYVALTQMPLADASSIQFLAPVLVSALSGVLLGERVGPKRWFAVACGFIGVLMVARPGSGVFGWVALLPLGCATLLAAYMILTRIIREKDNPQSTTFYSTAVGALALSVMVPFTWHDLSSGQWSLMVFMGGAGAMGHFFLVRAFHMAEASVLAPFTYSQVVAAIFWGVWMFGDIPSPWTIAGALLVIGSGLYVWYRETYRKVA